MESSDPSSADTRTESDVFQSDVQPEEKSEPEIRESVARSGKNQEKITAIVCYILLDYMTPLFMILCALATTAIIGMILQVILILHFIGINKRTGRGLLIFTLGAAFVVSTVVFIAGIVSTADPDDSFLATLFGLTFRNVICKRPMFGIIVSLLSMVHMTITLMIMKSVPPQHMKKLRVRIFRKVFTQYLLSLTFMVCVAVLGSTNMSYVFFPLLVYYLYTNISLAFCGRVVLKKIIHFIMAGYALLFSMFEFYMVSFVGLHIAPIQLVSFSTIESEHAQRATLVFSLLLTVTSIELLTANERGKWVTKRVPHMFKYFADSSIILVLFCVFLYAAFYPSLLSFYWMIITFWACFCNLQVVKRLFFPFLALTFCVCFVVLGMYQYTEYPEEDGTDNNVMFSKVFGLYNFVGNSVFTFEILGFLIMGWMGQIGRYRYRQKRPIARKRKQYVIPDIDNINVDKLKREIHLTKISIRLRVREKRLRSLIKRIGMNVLTLLYYAAQGASFLLAIYASFDGTRYAFQVFAAINLILVVSMCYHVYFFWCIAFLSGLLIMVCTYYKSFDIDNCYETGKCLTFGMFDAMWKSGLVPPSDRSLVEYLWPILIVFIVNVVLMKMKDTLDTGLPLYMIYIMRLAVVIDQICYVFYVDVNVFSMFYFVLGILSFASFILSIRVLFVMCHFLTSLLVTLELTCYYFTHQADARNWLCSFISPSILDLTDVVNLNGKVVLIAFMAFFNSVSFRWWFKNTDIAFQKSEIVTEVLTEIARIVKTFHFYVCWIMVFAWSIADSYPNLIKFIFIAIFHFGSCSPALIHKGRVIAILVITVYIICQFVFEVFYRDVSEDAQRVFSYIGCYFCRHNTRGARQEAIGYQFGLILLLLITCHPGCHAEHSEHFESLALTRIYNGLCALLHYWLPVIVQSAIFISTFYNPTVFAWISFIVLAIFAAKRSSMRRTAGIVTFCLNVCFLVQYLLYLGWPRDIFAQIPFWSIMSYIPKDRQEVAISWFRYLGIYDIKTESLMASCLSAMASTFYLQFYQTDMDHDARYRDLPVWTKGFVNAFAVSSYYIFLSLAIVCTALVTSMDGVLFYIVMSLLFIGSILFGYNRKSTMTIANAYMMCVFSMKVLSRIPVFRDTEIVKKTFDLPFGGQCENTLLWIIIFTLLKLCDNVTRSNLCKEQEKYAVQHLAYRYIRERQLRIIERLDQDILIAKRNAEVSAVFREHNLDLFEPGASVKIEDPKSDETSMTVSEKQWTRSWTERIYEVLVVDLSRKLVKLMCSSLPVNAEPGMNVLTLESVTVLMKRCLNAFLNGRVIELEPREQEFLRSLPPSFTHQYTSLACLIHYKYIRRDDIWFLLLKYLFLFIRKSSLVFLVVVSIVYTLVNPYVFSILVTLCVLCAFCSIDIRSYPHIYRFFFMFVFTILGLRACARASVIRDRLLLATGTVEYLGNTYSLFALIGLQPDDRIASEILLFLASVWFVLDQLGSAKLFSPNHYFKKFKSALDGFPDDYCYGIINDPIQQLGMKARKPLSVVQYLREQFSRKSLRSTSHKTIALILDLISLVRLVILWSFWENSYSQVVPTAVNYTFRIGVSFVFVCLVHVVFTLLVYFLQLAQNYFGLLIVNALWVTYTLAINFFYLASRWSGLPDTLYLFIIIRLLSHIVVAHKCYTGRVFVTFRCPRFIKNHGPIKFVNRFIRSVPFVFELQTLLTWMIEPTKVSLHDFFLVRDVAMRLEILISRQMELAHAADKKQRRIFRGMIWLLLFLALVFIPLFILVERTEDLYNNSLQSMTVSVGFSEYPALYKGIARVRGISSQEKQVLVSTSDSTLRDIASVPGDTVYVASLTPNSNEYPRWTDTTEARLLQDIDDPNTQLTLSLVIEMVFERPATKEYSRTILYDERMNATEKIRSDFKDAINGNTTSLVTGLTFPGLLFILSNRMYPISYEEMQYSLILSYSPGDLAWNMVPHEVDPMWGLSDIVLLVYSEQVTDMKGKFSSTAGQDELMVIYILLLIIVGVVVRSRTLGHLDQLWIHRLDAPHKLYNMIIAIQLVRNAGDVDKEAELVNKFLDIVRSHEQVLTLTDRNT